MKGLILSAGKGLRLKELELKHKSLAVVSKKHVIDYSLDLLADLGKMISEIVIVVGYRAEEIIDYVGDDYKSIPVKYVIQKEQLGIAHAVKTAKPLLDDSFILCLADEILFESRLASMVSFFEDNHLDCAVGGIIDGEDFSMKPIAYEIDDAGKVKNVFEKPDEYKNSWRGVGECIFRRESLLLLDKLKPNPKRNEYEMGDWIQMIINEGGVVRPFKIAKGYANINWPKDIMMAEEMMDSYNYSKRHY